MAKIQHTEELILQKILEMSQGYVLDFTNSSFQQFIYGVCNLDIFDPKYAVYGESKAKRLRSFWQKESDQTVGKLLNELLAHLKTSKKINNIEFDTNDKILFNDCLRVANRLRGITDKSSPKKVSDVTEDEFLKREYKNISIDSLNIDSSVIAILNARLNEIQLCLKCGSSISVVIMCGSVLEGLLLGMAISNAKEFNQSTASPKDKTTGKVLVFQDWTLSNLIDVSHEIGLIGLDVKKFCHNLRDFRNYIHPYMQMTSGFSPDIDTARISWQVLQAAISDLTKK